VFIFISNVFFKKIVKLDIFRQRNLKFFFKIQRKNEQRFKKNNLKKRIFNRDEKKRAYKKKLNTKNDDLNFNVRFL
jgi:hypothetical protein